MIFWNNDHTFCHNGLFFTWYRTHTYLPLLQKGDWNTLTGKKLKNKNEKGRKNVHNVNFAKPKSVWMGLENWIENYTFQLLVYKYTTAAATEKLPDTTVVLKLLFFDI